MSLYSAQTLFFQYAVDLPWKLRNQQLFIQIQEDCSHILNQLDLSLLSYLKGIFRRHSSKNMAASGSRSGTKGIVYHAMDAINCSVEIQDISVWFHARQGVPFLEFFKHWFHLNKDQILGVATTFHCQHYLTFDSLNLFLLQWKGTALSAYHIYTYANNFKGSSVFPSAASKKAW